MDLRLKGSVAVVAGASRGIGRYIAHALGVEGVRLLLLSRSSDDLASVVADFEAEEIEAYGLPVDLTQGNAGERIAAEVKTRFGHANVYIGNAGGNRRKEFSETSDEDWHEIIELNLVGHIRASRSLIPLMTNQQNSSIIFIASIFGREAGGAGLSIYNATKSALISTAKIMSIELASKGIRVNSVAPGSIRFPGGSWDRRCIADPKAMEDFVTQNIPLGRFGRADEVADVVTFLASERASLVTGACINVDGGQSRSLI